MLIIGQQWGGLGDNLQFSTIPECYDKQGVCATSWCELSVFNKCRNQEIFDLVWGHNDFLWQKKSPRHWNMPEYRKIDGLSFIETWEKLCGFEPQNIAPKIYYRPQPSTVAKDVAICDLSAISAKDQYRNLGDKIFSTIPRGSLQLLLEGGSYPAFSEDTCRFRKIESIYHLCDMIFSCKEFWALNSGAACLASAIKANYRPDLDVKILIPRDYYLSLKSMNIHIYPNLEYIPL